ncbi:MAG TPA: PaaI family thioesterase, partial [Albitalea sp.]|nr:PaaI family thioesterase [Albitalea sp.]
MTLTAIATPPSTDATLAAWQAREAQLRRQFLPAGLGRPDQFAGRSGIEIFQAMLAGEIPVPPISETLDFILVEAEPGRVQFQGKPQFEHYNPMGTVHGGVFCDIADAAMGMALASTLDPDQSFT